MIEMLQWIESWPTSTFVRESGSLLAFPTFLFVHSLGVSIVAGGSAMLAFALLGGWPTATLRPLERVYPVIWLGFWINLVTGVGLLLADASTKGLNPVVWIKLAFVIGGVVFIARARRDIFRSPALDAGIPPRARFMAWGSLVCWFSAIVAGRLIAYVGGGR
jgi:hypothetical protein